jgi:pSer/pThr/pTyr-binding forkhead associated (FHA) protein
MPGRVTLSVVRGKLKGKTFHFAGRTLCIIGRAPDCNLKLPDDEEHRTISRYHCLLDINPPHVRARDFGSFNGTYINGKKIGQRAEGRSADTVKKETFPEFDLQDGDEIMLGTTKLKVETEGDENTETLKLNPTPEKTEPAPAPSSINSVLHRARTARRDKPSIEGFTLLEKLGARDEKTGEQVAVKTLLPQVAIDDMARGMFLREVKNMEMLRHPNLVGMKGSGCVSGTFYVSLEYCDSGSVADLIEDRAGSVSVDEAVPLALQALEGLEYAHDVEIAEVDPEDGSVVQSRGLVHRDLKPDNIYLSKVDGKLMAKVGDFGLSKAFDLAGLNGHTITGSTAGTPLYMPRQQILDYKYAKPEVDVWALAASLYKMLTGITPRTFKKGDDPWLVALTNSSVPIRKINPRIPKPLAKVIDKALIDNPEIHFKSATQLKKALKAAL